MSAGAKGRRQSDRRARAAGGLGGGGASARSEGWPGRWLDRATTGRETGAHRKGGSRRRQDHGARRASPLRTAAHCPRGARARASAAAWRCAVGAGGGSRTLPATRRTTGARGPGVAAHRHDGRSRAARGPVEAGVAAPPYAIPESDRTPILREVVFGNVPAGITLKSAARRWRRPSAASVRHAGYDYLADGFRFRVLRAC